MADFTVPVYITSTNKRRNSTQIVSDGTELQCSFKDDVSVTSPKIFVKVDPGTDTSLWNYMHIPALNRYYFITTSIKVTATTVMCIGEVDVLATYREEILETDAYVYYSQSKYNTWISDDRLVQENHMIFNGSVYKEILGYTEVGSYCVTYGSADSTSGDGMSTSVIMTKDQLRVLANDLWNGEALDVQTYKPTDAIISCIWLPFTHTLLETSEISKLVIEGKQFGFPCNVAKNTYAFHDEIAITQIIPHRSQDPETLLWSFADFRNVSPYTKYYISLPGVGIVELPMSTLIDNGGDFVKVLAYDVSIAPDTGDITYSIPIRAINSSSDRTINHMVIKGNIGVQKTIASSNPNAQGMIAGMLSMAAGALTATAGGVVGSPTLVAFGASSMISGGINALTASREAEVNIRGNNAGFQNMYLNEKIVVTSFKLPLSEEPNNLRSTIGRPLFKRVKLGTLSGVVVATGVMVSAAGATSTELDMINDMVNKSRQYDYGGIIIE